MRPNIQIKPHHELLQEVAYILSAQDVRTADALLLAATWDGLSNIADKIADELGPSELVRVRSRLAAVQAQNETNARVLWKRLVDRLIATKGTDEVPWDCP